jgi:RNA recognition motif-containing protein
MRIFVKNLPMTMTEDELRRLFAAYGTVTDVETPLEEETQRSRGWGHIRMPDTTEAHAAMAGLHGQTIEGQRLIVTQAYWQGARRLQP